MTKRLINKELKIIKKLIHDDDLSREYIIFRITELLNYINFLYRKCELGIYVYNEKFDKIMELVLELNLNKPVIKTFENSIQKPNRLAEIYHESFIRSIKND